MRLLLDTNALIWALQAPDHLRPEASAALADRQNEIYVSIASIWEAAIKVGIGKLVLPPEFIPTISRSGFRIMAIEIPHALRVSTLPRHHRDPFDRILVAQALVEDLTLVTRDAMLPLYGVPILTA